jgi:hypothetical protein
MDKKGKSEHPEELPPEPQQAAQPDRRGRIAWLQVLVGFLATVNSFGFISAFGVFQIHYPFSLYASPSQVSWIGSTPLFLLTALCVLSGRLVDAGYFYATVITGAVLQVIGIYCASVAKSYGAVLFTQGIFMGVGCGSMYAPCIWLVATRFERRKSLAIGIASTGAPFGALVFTGVSFFPSLFHIFSRYRVREQL